MSKPVQKGTLRKRPRYGAGCWQSRFFVLTEDDCTLRAYSKDPSTTTSKEPETPSHTIVLSDDMTASDPFEKSVRTSTTSSKKEKVYAVEISRKEKDGALRVFTIGGATKDEATQWKKSLEAVIKRAGPAPTERATNTKSLKHRESLWSKDDKWQVVEVQDGIEIEGETEFTKEFPSLRARCEVKASTQEVFNLIMDDSKRSTWDEGVQLSEVIKEVSDSCAIVYMQMRGIWLGPLFTGARDLCLLRYYRKDDDGVYTITWQSVEDPILSPPREGFVRGRVFAMVFTITPATETTSKVYLTCHADPGGLLTNSPSVVLQRWLLPFVTRITGIKKALGTTQIMEDKPGISGTDLPPPEEKAVPATTPTSTPKSTSTADVKEVNTLRLGSWNPPEWMETPDEATFTIRGKTYLEDSIKYKTDTKMFHLVAAELYKLEQPTPHIAARSDAPLVEITKAYPDRKVFVMQFMLPGPPFYSVAFYAVAKKGVLEEDSPFSRLWNDFVEGDDQKKNSMLKIIPRITQGSYVVKKTVGEVPALLGQKMKMVYYHGPNYLEADCDLGTSAVAGSILSIVKGYATTVTLDLGILLEGHTIDELPESMMCSLRIIKPVLAKCQVLPPDPDPATTKKNRDLVENASKGTGSDD